MTSELLRLLRFPNDERPPRLTALESRAGRVTAGVLVSGDGARWAPVVDGVVALSEVASGPPPTSISELVGQDLARPLFAGHRDWDPEGDPDLARVAFGPRADRLLSITHALAGRLAVGAVVVVRGDDSGWAASAVAALLLDQEVIALIDGAGPLGLSGCRQWLAASDAPANLSVVVADAGDKVIAAEDAIVVIDFATLEPGEPPAPPIDIAPSRLHALINPGAPIDLNRAQIGERLLDDTETKVLYWASRAASVARTAERIGCEPDEVINALTRLHDEGFVRLQCLPAAMTRLHVFWSTGEALLPLAEQTLGHVADFGFKAFAERIYIHNANDGSTMTYGETAEVIQRAASALHRDGVRAGDRVCVHAIPHVEVPLIFWACVHLGAVFVPIGSIWSREVASSILSRCQPKALFINDEVRGRIPEYWLAQAIRLDPAGDTADPTATEPLFSDWLGDAPPRPATHTGLDECAVVLFTSGTTGIPKGVQLSNAAITLGGHASGATARFAMSDVVISLVECIAPGGLKESLLATVMSGASMVIADPTRRGNSLGLVELCGGFRVTILRSVPAGLRQLCRLADRVDQGAMASIRLIICGSAPLHQETLDAVSTICSARVLDTMGMTEAFGGSVFSDLSMERGSVAAHGSYPRGAVTQTVDETARVICDGSIGSLRVLSDRLMIGYLEDPERTAYAVSAGWLHTGDLARWEPAGPLRIAGRAVEMIKSAWGDKVFPIEIEAALMADERVHEVAACGFTDADGTERIAAFVTPSNTPDDPDRLIENLKTRVREALGDSKVPGVVVLVDDMPRLAREKVNKRELVATYLQP